MEKMICVFLTKLLIEKNDCKIDTLNGRIK